MTSTKAIACSAGPRNAVMTTSFIESLQRVAQPTYCFSGLARSTTFDRIQPMSGRSAEHVVAVVAAHGVVPFDLATPTEIFRGARLADGRAPYRLVVCGVERTVRATDFEIRVRAGLEALARADTIIVPGVGDFGAPVPGELVSALRRAAKRGARIASI